ncbi:hypothetical protein QU38_01710, partial [Staphylococcus aureus]
VRAHHEAVPSTDAGGPGAHARPQGGAAAPGRDEAVDGSADPSLQAVQRRLSRARGRRVCRDGEPEGRVRRLSGLGRQQQAVPVQDPPDCVQPPPGDGLHVEGAHARRHHCHPGRARHRVRGVRPVSADRIAIAHEMIAHYNAQDADAYV